MILLPWFSRQGSAPGSSNVRPALTTVRVSGPFNQTRRDARFRRSRGPFYKSRSARLADLISEADQTYDPYSPAVVMPGSLATLGPRNDGGSARSKLDHRAVLGNEHAGGADLVEMGEHERAHVGQHDPARAQIGQPRLEHLPAEVARHMSGIAVALDNEEIGAVGDGYQGIDPFGVAGVGEQRLAVRETQRRRWRAGIVHDLGGRDRMSQHFGLPP